MIRTGTDDTAVPQSGRTLHAMASGARVANITPRPHDKPPVGVRARIAARAQDAARRVHGARLRIGAAPAPVPARPALPDDGSTHDAPGQAAG